MRGISALIRVSRDLALLCSLPYEDNEKLAICNPEEGPHQNLIVLALDCEFPASRVLVNKFLLFLIHPVSGIVLEKPELTKVILTMHRGSHP